MAQNITLLGASYSNVPAVELPKTGGGTAKFADPSGVTAAAADVASGKYFLDATGAFVAGTASGGGGANIGTGSASGSSSYPTSISFTGLQGAPLAFFVRCTTSISSSGSSSYYYVVSMRYNGTNTYGNYFRVGSTRQVANVTSGYSFTYSNGTLTIRSSASSRSSSPGAFYNGSYELTYIY